MSKPKLVCLDDYEENAIQTLNKDTLRYYRVGTDEEITVNENRMAFRRLKLLPRVLRDVSKRDLSTTILGERIDFPVCIAPSGYQRMACDQGELSTVKAAGKMKTCMVLSSLSTFTLEDVSRSSPDALKWFQLYVWRYREITVDVIRRAERAGFKALVVTVDVPYTGTRRRDVITSGANFSSQIHMVHIPDKYKSAPSTIKEEYGGLAGMFDPTLTWDIIKWIRSITKLPIVLKGILSPEDALLAVEHKVDGIIVSNHGGRQLDTVPATIEVLPHIIKAVNGRTEVYLDGGVRTGTDVFKALALGARAVFIGRPIVYGLVYAGENGATQVLEIMKDELSLSMALSGCTTVSDINPSYVLHEACISKM